MEKLPMELKLSLLHNIDSLKTLHNFIQTSRSIYHAFIADKASILSSTLQRQIGSENMTHALVMHNSSQLELLEEYDILTIEAFIDRNYLAECQMPAHTDSYNHCYYLVRCQIPAHLDSRTHLFKDIARFQSVLEWFTDDFCKSTSQVKPLLHSDPLAPDEKTRIHRAFYRFEIFRTLFCTQSFDRDDVLEIFIHRIPPWEDEELACVHDYLSTKIELCKKSLPDHDIESYKLHASPMSNGLCYLYQLFNTGDDQKRLDMMYDTDTVSLEGCNDFLKDCLNGGFHLGMKSVGSHMEHLPFRGDIEGPNAGWLAVHSNKYKVAWAESGLSYLRTWGYCFWSKSRFEANRTLEEVAEAVAHPYGRR